MTWIIVRTDHRKEYYVAGRIRAALGLEAWVPSQFVARRPAIARRVTAKALTKPDELPILPKRLFVSGAGILDREVQSELRTLRHVEALETGADQRLVLIPDAQIATFRATIARENAAAMALVAAKNRKQKARWRSLKDALMDLVDSARQQTEEAA